MPVRPFARDRVDRRLDGPGPAQRGQRLDRLVAEPGRGVVPVDQPGVGARRDPRQHRVRRRRGRSRRGAGSGARAVRRGATCPSPRARPGRSPCAGTCTSCRGTLAHGNSGGRRAVALLLAGAHRVLRRRRRRRTRLGQDHGRRLRRAGSPTSVFDDARAGRRRKAAEATVRGCHREAEQGYVEVRDRTGDYDKLCATLDRTGGVGAGVAGGLARHRRHGVRGRARRRDVGQTKVAREAERRPGHAGDRRRRHAARTAGARAAAVAELVGLDPDRVPDRLGLEVAPSSRDSSGSTVQSGSAAGARRTRLRLSAAATSSSVASSSEPASAAQVDRVDVHVRGQPRARRSRVEPVRMLTTPPGTSEVASTSLNVTAGSGRAYDDTTTQVLPETITGATTRDQPEQRGLLRRQHGDHAGRLGRRQVEERPGHRVRVADHLGQLVGPAGVPDQPVDRGVERGRGLPRRQPLGGRRARRRTAGGGPPSARRSGRSPGPGCTPCGRPSRRRRRGRPRRRRGRPCATPSAALARNFPLASSTT